ncbi:hypothetical protein B0A50_08830 [Salinomyces thailandicus]|nr:hypothetical protein B0A50_08830 [Salinomyces thailandica]
MFKEASVSGEPRALPIRSTPTETSAGEQLPKDSGGEAGPSAQGPRDYSNEARVYHCRYAELSEAHDNGRYYYCRDGCLDLLTEPRLPLYTRVQTLQMVSTLFHPTSAEAFLDEAQQLLDEEMDPSKFQVILLKEDNGCMKADLKIWRDKRGTTGGEGEQDDAEPSAEWFRFDREMEQKLDEDLQEEMEPFGRRVPSPQKAEGEEKPSLPSPRQETVGGMPSPDEESD